MLWRRSLFAFDPISGLFLGAVGRGDATSGEQMPLEPLDQEVADDAAREARWIEVRGFIMLFASFKIARLGVAQIVSRFG